MHITMCTMLYLCCGFKNESLFFHLLIFSCLLITTLQSKLPVFQIVIILFTFHILFIVCVSIFKMSHF